MAVPVRTITTCPSPASLPEKPVWYAPGREPERYLEWLREQEPQVTFEPAGAYVPKMTRSSRGTGIRRALRFQFVFSVSDVRNPAWFEHVKPPITKTGVMPFAAYVIREKGKIELGTFACAMCHTRVLPDGTIVKGAQGNFPIDRANAFGFRHTPQEVVRNIYRMLSGAPWLKPDPADQADTLSAEEIATQFDAAPAGVLVRHRSSMNYPVAIPDLIGLKNRRYLDRTGLVQHRAIGDLMRYAALNNEMDFLSKFGDFVPRGQNYKSLPDPSTQLRYSEEQLYALSLYIYSLKPPKNPNRPNGLTLQGRKYSTETAPAATHHPFTPITS